MNRIKQLRLANKLSQAELGRRTKISNQSISAYESGYREPNSNNWQALADFFNVSVPYLQGKISYKDLDPLEKGIYGYVTKVMDRAFKDCALLPVQQERILKAIAYSIDNGEFN